MSDDRPKKSWREIDAARDRKQESNRRDPSEQERERAKSTAAYKKYKGALDKLFSPGTQKGLPENLREKLGPQDEASKARQEIVRRLHEASDAESLTAYLATNSALPDEPRLLFRLLDISDPRLLVPVLTTLKTMVDSERALNKSLLAQKLDAVVLRHPRTDAARLAAEIRSCV